MLPGALTRAVRVEVFLFRFRFWCFVRAFHFCCARCKGSFSRRVPSNSPASLETFKLGLLFEICGFTF